MVKVAIIEDNPVTVRSLEKTIDWAKLGCELCGSANDGLAGKELILRERPDIVMTDIRMPNKDGLDMIEEVRPLMPDLIVIILTCYDHFQYASRAIKLSAFDYILKPIRNDEVEQAITRAIDMMNRKLQKEEMIAEADKLQTRAQLLSLLTNMSHTGQNVLSMMKEAGLDSASYFLVIMQPEELGSLTQTGLNGTDELLEDIGIRVVSVILYDSVVLYIMRDQETGPWREEAEEICRRLRGRFPMRMNIGISNLEISHHRVRETYQQARQALYESAMHPDSDENVFFRENMGDSTGVLTDMRKQVDELVEEAELTEESADRAAATLVHLSGQQYSQLRAMVSLYAMLLSRKFPCNDNGAVDRALGNTWFVTKESNVADCLRGVCNALREGRESEESKCSLLTRNVLDYIRIHGADKLSLNDVADHFHVSANYLSALVRKETGITFHEHIINVKMDIAHNMLADPRILVEEVAYAVGYSNYVSFYNVFKQKEHMTPTEYRNMLAVKE